MAHPFNEHRAHKVEHDRVARFTRGYASGGAVHSDEKADRKLFKKLMAEEDSQAVEGGEAKERMDRPGRAGRAGKKRGGKVAEDMEANDLIRPRPVNRARGGRTKHGKGHTTVNVITGGGHPAAPLAVGGPPPGGIPGMGASPMPPPRPPMAPPGLPPGAPGMAPPGMGGPPGMPPPGMPPRHSGGRAYAKGGRVKRAGGGYTDIADESPMTAQEEMDASQRRLAALPAGSSFKERWNTGPSLSVLGRAFREVGKVRKPIAKPGEQRRWDDSLDPKTIARARGGAVKDGPAWNEGRKAGTPVQNNPSGKNDQRDVGRGKPVTYKKGGGVNRADGGAANQLTVGEQIKRRRMQDMIDQHAQRSVEPRPSGAAGYVKDASDFMGGLASDTGRREIEKLGRRTGGRTEAPQGVSAPHLPGGSGGGEARLAKEKMAKRGHGMAP